MPTSLKAFPIPAHDVERIAALRKYDILDTLPEQAYDDITLLAGQLCGVPISLVSLVDADRQWFKSKIGTELMEMPRYASFCTHAILKPVDLFIVEDAAADPRFADNILVLQSPFIRFYAGAPLVTAEGHALGTLCVIDQVPRKPTEQQLDALRALARQIVAHLELRRSLAELKLKDEIMEECQRELEQYQLKLRDANAQLHKQSFTDGLTGVYNRRAFDLHLAQAVTDATSQRESLSLVMLDVDHFKRFNDDYGHLAGDEVLRGVAASIQSAARKNDIVARYGGEEFAVILPGVGNERGLSIAGSICTGVRKTEWQDRHVTISAGVATLEGSHSSGDTLMAAADHALYQAKMSGRDRAVGFVKGYVSQELAAKTSNPST
jgi:diguanylate cyclase (GGDEF)-like protein